MTDLIQRLQDASEGSRELDAAIAKAMGWAEDQAPHNDLGIKKFWKRDKEAQWTLPIYRSDIRLTLAEIERRGWVFHFSGGARCGYTCVVSTYPKNSVSASSDRNLDLAALEALLKAMGE
jgi:hypothetical protein